MRNLLAPAHLALTVIILIWDIVLAGRIAQNGQAARPLQAHVRVRGAAVVPALLLYSRDVDRDDRIAPCRRWIGSGPPC